MSEDEKPENMSDENDPKISKSQEIPPDKDFDLAAENGQLKEKLKQAESGLKNGEKIAEERVKSEQKKAEENQREVDRLSRIDTIMTPILLVLVLGCGYCFLSNIYKSDKEVQNLKDQLGNQTALAEYWKEGAEYLSKKRLEAEEKIEPENSTTHLRKQIEKLVKEKAELETEKVTLEVSAEKAKAEAADLREKLAAEKAELQKKLDEPSATTASGKEWLALDKAEKLTKQKKMAEELVRSWCGVPVVQSTRTTTEPTAPADEKNNASRWAPFVFIIVVVLFLMSLAFW